MVQRIAHRLKRRRALPDRREGGQVQRDRLDAGVGLAGLNPLFFFSREGNEPPHIHVESAENAAKFWLRPVTL